SRREWNTPVREPWNVLIHQALQAVDRHNRLFFDTGDRWHLQQASALRSYVRALKTWIHQQEAQAQAPAPTADTEGRAEA
ncbi:MAG: Synechococcus phage, partial [Cyanobacteriota bacterium]